MFDTWHDFFLLTGPASSSLLGLLFVVVTLTAGFDHETTGHGTRIYTTPTVFHLVVVVVLSGGALLYAGILVAEGAEAAPWALAGGVLGLLLMTVHNAWDLVTWMAPRVKRP